MWQQEHRAAKSNELPKEILFTKPSIKKRQTDRKEAEKPPQMHPHTTIHPNPVAAGDLFPNQALSHF